MWFRGAGASPVAVFILLALCSYAGAVEIQVAAGIYHTVGLKSDGTVMAVGDNNYGELNVSQWVLDPVVVSGTVMDKGTHAGIPNAQLMAEHSTGEALFITSDPWGNYELLLYLVGPWTVRAGALGYVVEPAVIDVVAGNEYHHDFYLSEPVSPSEGTVGTEIVVVVAVGTDLGLGGKVFLQKKSGTYPLKVLEWNIGDSGKIKALLKKAIPPGTYDVIAIPKKADPITELSAFTVKEAAITSVVPDHGTVGQEIMVNGEMFGTKVKVYLEDKSTFRRKKCKGAGLFMDKTSGVSWVNFLVPKGLADGTYNLILKNNLGEAPKVNFTVGP